MKPNNTDTERKGRLRNRMIHAGGWVASAFVFGQVLRFGSNLILTRLLVPEMFGVMAIVTVVQIGLTMFSDVGLLQNVVQSRRGGESLFLNTVWVLQIVRGCLLFLIMLVVSWLLVEKVNSLFICFTFITLRNIRRNRYNGSLNLIAKTNILRKRLNPRNSIHFNRQIQRILPNSQFFKIPHIKKFPKREYYKLSFSIFWSLQPTSFRQPSTVTRQP